MDCQICGLTKIYVTVKQIKPFTRLKPSYHETHFLIIRHKLFYRHVYSVISCFSKKDNTYDLLFAFLNDEPLEKRGLP